MRREITVTVPGTRSEDQGARDNGKTFVITEMSAVQAERWANRATLALMPRLSREVSPDVAAELRENPTMPYMGRVFALLQGVAFPELEPLLDELMGCVKIRPDPTRPQIQPRALGVGGSEDIEEVETIRMLREEALNLHTGFTLAASVLNLMAAISRVSIFEATPTSLSPSERLSPETLPSPPSESWRPSTVART